MRVFTHARLALPALGLLFGLGAAAPAVAQSASTLNEDQGASTGLGSSHRFASQAAAASHCPGDTVVWSSGSKLVYHVPNSADYGHGAGFYACKAEADDAGFTPAGG